MIGSHETGEVVGRRFCGVHDVDVAEHGPSHAGQADIRPDIEHRAVGDDFSRAKQIDERQPLLPDEAMRELAFGACISAAPTT